MPPARAARRSDRDVPDQPKPRSDAHTGILILALGAQLAGALFLYLDYSQYPSSAPDIKTIPKPGDAVKSGAQPAAQPGQPGQPGQPAPGAPLAPAPQAPAPPGERPK